MLNTQDEPRRSTSDIKTRKVIEAFCKLGEFPLVSRNEQPKKLALLPTFAVDREWNKMQILLPNQLGSRSLVRTRRPSRFDRDSSTSEVQQDIKDQGYTSEKLRNPEL